jgi:hypothetical protein
MIDFKIIWKDHALKIKRQWRGTHLKFSHPLGMSKIFFLLASSKTQLPLGILEPWDLFLND